MKHFSRLKTCSILAMSLFIFLHFTEIVGAETKGGDIEINTQVSFIHTNIDDFDDDTDTLFLTGRVGYFFTPAINFEGALSIIGNSTGDIDFVAVSFDGRTNYHFNTSGKIIPYLGPSFGMFHSDIDAGDFDESDTGGIFGGQVGVKSFLTETVAITTEWNIKRTVGLEFDTTINTLFLGISYFWR